MYNVALLIERQLAEIDALQIIELHEGVDDDVTYHLVLPVENSAVLLSASMSALAAGQLIPLTEPQGVEEVQQEIEDEGTAELNASTALLRSKGLTVTSRLTTDDPVSTLVEVATSTSADEIIILTEPHVVREFLHLDWTSQVRRELDIPTLHLLEHRAFEDQQEL